jgi:hypothetical protein
VKGFVDRSSGPKKEDFNAAKQELNIGELENHGEPFAMQLLNSGPMRAKFPEERI